MKRKYTQSPALLVARAVATGLAVKGEQVHSDAVHEVMARRRIKLGGASGSLFRPPNWRTTDQTIMSTRKVNHGRKLKIWQYVGNVGEWQWNYWL
jgi:hypothetical protein